MTIQELRETIALKETELNKLKGQYDSEAEDERNAVLSKKSKGLEKVFYLLGFEFVSSCERTPQYREFHRVFKRDFTKFLKEHGCHTIEISKPNHFDVTGFFTDKKGQIWYFSFGDLRWSKGSMLIRTAKGYKDYTGGTNNDASMRNEEYFRQDFESILRNSRGF